MEFFVFGFGALAGILIISYFMGEKVETPRPTMRMA